MYKDKGQEKGLYMKRILILMIVLFYSIMNLCAASATQTITLKSTIPVTPLSVRLVTSNASEKGIEDVDTVDFKDFSVLNTEYEVLSGEYQILYSYNMPGDYVTTAIQMEAFSYGLRLQGSDGSYPIGVAFVDSLGNSLNWPALAIEPGKFLDETYVKFHLKLVNKDRIRLAAGVYSGEVVFTMTAE